jgi:hypothetical protein
MKKTYFFWMILGIIWSIIITLGHTVKVKQQIHEIIGWKLIYQLGYHVTVFFWFLGVYLILAIKVWLQKFENKQENRILIMINAVVFLLSLLIFYQIFFGGIGIWSITRENHLMEPIISLETFLLVIVVFSLISLVIFVWKYIQRIKN